MPHLSSVVCRMTAVGASCQGLRQWVPSSSAKPRRTRPVVATVARASSDRPSVNLDVLPECVGCERIPLRRVASRCRRFEHSKHPPKPRCHRARDPPRQGPHSSTVHFLRLFVTCRVVHRTEPSGQSFEFYIVGTVHTPGGASYPTSFPLYFRHLPRCAER